MSVPPGSTGARPGAERAAGAGPTGTGGPGAGVPRLHVLVPDAAAGRPDIGELAAGMLRGGAGDVAIHLRLRTTPGRAQHGLAEELSAAARKHGGWCVVNERVDVALTAGAQAVQLGASAMPLPVVREITGRGAALGASVHGVDEGIRAARRGANFLVLGTIFDSPTHPGIEGAGLSRVRSCSVRVALPVVAIGGMTPSRVGEVRGAGARGVAVLSRVWDSPDPAAAVGEFLDALAGAAAARGGNRRVDR